MSLQTPALEIAFMTQNELQIAVHWAQLEGWNPGVDDVSSFYAADPQGFLIGKINQQPVACISAVRYGTSFGFIGLYIVEASQRHKGYGIQLWNKALKYLQGRNIGLDGVLAQQDNYRKSGFTLAHRNIRYAGIAQRLPHEHAQHSERIVQLSSLPIESLTTYDQNFFPEARKNFLQAWIQQAHGHALGIIENQKLVAYGVIRACHHGYKIGPLNAENKDLAVELFHALISKVPENSTIYLDTPEPNTQAMEIAESYAMQPCFETARMYTGSPPPLPLHKIFGITSFELG